MIWGVQNPPGQMKPFIRLAGLPVMAIKQQSIAVAAQKRQTGHQDRIENQSMISGDFVLRLASREKTDRHLAAHIA